MPAGAEVQLRAQPPGVVHRHHDRDVTRGGSRDAVRREKEQMLNVHDVGPFLPDPQHLVGEDLSFTGAGNGELLFLGDWFVELGDLFDGGAPGKRGGVDMAFGRFGAGEKEEIIDDVAKPLAFRDGRLDHVAVFVRRSAAGESDFRFAANIRDRGAELVGEVGRELGKTGE